MKKTKQLAFFVEEDLAQALALAAKKNGRPQSELIRAILRKALMPDQAPQLKIGELAAIYIREGLTNAEVANKILGERPDAKTSVSSVAWYRSKMKKSGRD